MNKKEMEKKDYIIGRAKEYLTAYWGEPGSVRVPKNNNPCYYLSNDNGITFEEWTNGTIKDDDYLRLVLDELDCLDDDTDERTEVEVSARSSCDGHLRHVDLGVTRPELLDLMDSLDGEKQ